MHTRGGFLRLLVPSLVLAAGFSVSAADMTKLTIQVKTDTGRPVDRAAVIVRFVQGRNYIKLGKKIRTTYELRTNEEGQANIPEIPQGTIRIQVIAKGYQTYGNDVEVTEPEKAIDITLQPPQPQYSAH